MTVKADIDRELYERAASELQNLGATATEFIRRYPDSAKNKLAALIGNGVTSRGLTMKLYEEARQQHNVRTLAKDLLYRKVVEEFPTGWFEDDKVRATVKLGSWHYDVLEFAPEYEQSAAAILTALGTTRKPHLGWKPKSADDERLRMLFEAHWD